MMNRKTILCALFAASAAVFAGQTAMAAGEDTSEPPKKTKTSSECTNGKIWDAKKNACVNAKKSDLSDDILFQAARELAYAGQYEIADGSVFHSNRAFDQSGADRRSLDAAHRARG